MNKNWTVTGSGLILFNKVLVSDGEQNWASRLHLAPNAAKIFSLPRFHATTGTEYRLGILPGYLFPSARSTIGHIRLFARECILSGWQLHMPHLEVAGLAAEEISEDDEYSYNAHILFMHQTVILDDKPNQLVLVSRHHARLGTDNGSRSLLTSSNFCFAFVVSQFQH